MRNSIVLGLLALSFAIEVRAQDLPDAPQPIRCEQVNMENGEIHYRDVPCPPVTVNWKTVIIKEQKPGPRMLTFRKSWQDPPIATNSQVFKSKFFWITNGAMWASMTAACLHSQATHEDFGSEAPAMGAVTALNYMMYRLVSPSFVMATSTYATYHYTKSFFQ